MTTHDSGATEPLTIGCPVFTADGDEIGRVKEIRGRYFKVDAPMRPDYWLIYDVLTGDGALRLYEVDLDGGGPERAADVITSVRQTLSRPAPILHHATIVQ